MTALAKYALQLYDALESEATVENYEGNEILIYRGKVTKLWNLVGGSNAYYSKIMRNLTNLGCIVMVQRGAANVDSIIALIRRPEADEIISGNRLTPAVDPAILRAEVESLKRNVGGINIAEALREIGHRLEQVEREVREVGKTT